RDVRQQTFGRRIDSLLWNQIVFKRKFRQRIVDRDRVSANQSLRQIAVSFGECRNRGIRVGGVGTPHARVCQVKGVRRRLEKARNSQRAPQSCTEVVPQIFRFRWHGLSGQMIWRRIESGIAQRVTEIEINRIGISSALAAQVEVSAAASTTSAATASTSAA